MSTSSEILTQADRLAAEAAALSSQLHGYLEANAPIAHAVPFLPLFTAFVLACVIGYYVVWAVTPALHSPLMGVTNAISSVIIVGALIAAGPVDFGASKIFGFIAVVLASINIFGGFVVTQRMLSMFKKKDKK